MQQMSKDYWKEIYKKKIIKTDPSDFAKYCLDNYFTSAQVIIDLGAGNCRDTVFFLENKLKVIAVDQSLPSMDEISDNKDIKKLILSNCKLVKNDFSKIDLKSYGKIDIYYSRWSIHAISELKEKQLFNNIYENFREDSLFCIEVRSTKDELFGKGKKLEKNAFYTDHYRRFIDINEFKKKIKNKFKIIYIEESNNFSKVGDNNPVLIRAILGKI